MTMRPIIRENKVEKYYKQQIKKYSGSTYKFTSPTINGVPDQLTLYDGQVFFVELKRPNGKAREKQKQVHQLFNKHGITVFILSTYDEVDSFIHNVMKGVLKEASTTKPTVIRKNVFMETTDTPTKNKPLNDIIESKIETYLKEQTKINNALAIKFVSPGQNGVPDQIILTEGHTYFVELKRPNGTVRDYQQKIHRDFKKQKINTHIIDTHQAVDTFIKTYVGVKDEKEIEPIRETTIRKII